MTFAQHACAAGRTELHTVSSTYTLKLRVSGIYFVCHCFASKLIVLQSSFTLLDGEAASAWEHPYIAFPETNAAIAIHNRAKLREFHVELEGSAVAVAIVGLKFGALFCHGGR